MYKRQPFNLLEPHRLLVRRGYLTKLSRDKDNERYFVLFNDNLMYGEDLPVQGMYRFLQIIPLAGLQATSLPDDIDPERAKKETPSDTMGGGLSMFQSGRKNMIRIQSEKESFILSASTPASKQAWLDILRETIDKCPKSGQTPTFSAPVWMQDSESRVCLACNRNFDTFHRRHHCRRCGLLFCKNCCKTKVMLHKAAKKPERVCNDCASIMKNIDAAARESFQDSQSSEDGRRSTRNANSSAAPPTILTNLTIDSQTDLS